MIYELPLTAQKVLHLLHDQILIQCKKGQEKYGESIDQAKDYDWNQMAMEELVDCVQYLMKENIRLNSMTKLMVNSKFGKNPINYEGKYNYLKELVKALRNTLDIKNVEILKNYKESESTLSRSLLAESYDANQQVIGLINKILLKDEYE